MTKEVQQQGIPPTSAIDQDKDRGANPLEIAGPGAGAVTSSRIRHERDRRDLSTPAPPRALLAAHRESAGVCAKRNVRT
jgi:hypothetical protein